jgi:hypothetical protein
MIHRSRIDTPGRDQLHRLLYESPYFSGTPQDIVEEILTCTTKERFDKGSVIVTEGEMGNCVYLVLEGATQVTLHDELLAKLSSGDWIGTGLEKLIPDNWTRTATDSLTHTLTLKKNLAPIAIRLFSIISLNVFHSLTRCHTAKLKNSIMPLKR